MTHLSVNVNKLATLRNSRGKNLPDVTLMAERILGYGAHGITVHPRPDERHIRTVDVFSLHGLMTTWNRTASAHAEFNIEGYPSVDFLEMIASVRPDQCTLVPDPPEALTSNAGWHLAGRETELSTVLKKLREIGVRSSVFVDPKDMSPANLSALGRLKPDRIELYTEAFADAFATSEQNQVLLSYVEAAERARELGIGVNAGHDLNQRNLQTLVKAIPWINEVSIGHALICEALEQGMETTISNYLRLLK
jgi:pyridoxine 5-phosphate synthase